MEPNPEKQPKKGKKPEPSAPQMPAKLPDINQGVEYRNSEGIPYTVPPSKPYKPPRPLAINQVLDGTTITPKFYHPKAYYPGTDETAGGTQFPKPSNTMVNKRNTKANTSTDGSGPSAQTSNANNPTDDLSNKKSAPEGKTKGAAPTGRTAVKHTTGVNFGPIEEDVHPAARRNTAHSNPDEIPDNQKTTADFLYEYDLMCLRDLIVAVGDLMTYSVNWNDLSTRRGRSSTCMYTNWSDADRAQRQAAELSLYRRDLSDIDLSYLECNGQEGPLYRRQLDWSSSILPGGVVLIGDVVLPKHLFKDPFLVVPSRNKYSRAQRIARRVGILPGAWYNSLAHHPAFENCSHVLHLRTGIVWRTKEGNLHFHGPVGGPVARLAYALRPEAQNLDIYHVNAEAPFSVTADRRLDDEFWRAVAYRYGRLQGWKRPVARHIDAEYVLVDAPDRQKLTKRFLLNYLIQHVLR
jgi:hypothetical protein